MLKNILILNDAGFVDGGGSQVAILSALALSKSHQIVFIYGVGPADKRLVEAENITLIDLKLNFIHSEPNRLRAAINGVHNKKANSSLAPLVAEFDPAFSVAHIYNFTRALSPSVIRVLSKQKFKIFISLLDYFLVCPNGALFNFPNQIICKLKPLSLKCVVSNCDKRSYSQKLWRLIRHFWLHINLKLAEKYITPVYGTDFSKKIMAPMLGFGNSGVRVNNPLNPVKTKKIKASQNSNLLFVGRLVVEKIPENALREILETGMTLRVAGDGDLLEYLRNKFPQIQFLGWLTPALLDKEFKQARALIFPSIWYETQGLSVKVAAAKGIPTISPISCASTDFVKHNKTGLLYDPAKTGDLKNKILKIKSDDFVDALGENAYNRYWSAPDTTKAYAEQLKFRYEQALDE